MVKKFLDYVENFRITNGILGGLSLVVAEWYFMEGYQVEGVVTTAMGVLSTLYFGDKRCLEKLSSENNIMGKEK
ncbi:MAG TPA: hypothetical protein VJZ93_01570 [Candidatus Nanoarchaeia archaeon]|nr:hypothetical protein [Candidatus Nanoarchaeia archaeon]